MTRKQVPLRRRQPRPSSRLEQESPDLSFPISPISPQLSFPINEIMTPSSSSQSSIRLHPHFAFNSPLHTGLTTDLSQVAIDSSKEEINLADCIVV